MPWGYIGKTGIVDLSANQVETRDTSEEIYRKYLGGKGLGSYFLHEYSSRGKEALSAATPLIFATGPLTGTSFPAASRSAVITRSPLTGTFLDSYAGGHFGPALRRAGFDTLIVLGQADAPVYIHIENGQISIRPAHNLWGLKVTETEHMLQQYHQNYSQLRFKTACIGPAGENLVRFASIMSEKRAFGRGGSGAVMGAKKLKAVLAGGNAKVEAADDAGFKAVVKRCRANIARHPMTGKDGVFPKLGTIMTVDLTQETGTLPTHNWRANTFDRARGIDGEAFLERIVRSRTCFACPIGCTHDAKAELDGAEYYAEGVEYETIYAFGSNCLIGDSAFIIAADQLCDEYGMDTISCGVTVGFAMECFERGLISAEEIQGWELNFGAKSAALALIHMIAQREDLGRVLADGTKAAAARINGAEDLAIHVKGLELPGYDPRGMKGQGLTYALADRGGCHMRSNTIRTELLGLPEPMDRFSYQDKAEMVFKLQMTYSMFDCLGACAFGGFALTPQDYAEGVAALTGWNFNLDELLIVAERAWNMSRMFNVMEGFTRQEDTLPSRLFKLSSKTGPSQNQIIDLSEFNRLLNQYYRVAGWDESSGIPRLEKLEDLGLGYLMNSESQQEIS